jgi:hypothetical protein
MDFDSKRHNQKLISLSFNQHDEETSKHRFDEKKNLNVVQPVEKSAPRSHESLKEKEFGWKQIETLNSVPPNDYTVTHINQNHELLVRFRIYKL